MKKMMLVGMLMVAVNLFADLNLRDANSVDQIGLAGLFTNKTKLDKEAAGRWYLYRALDHKYQQVVNDEFELEDAISNAYKELITKIDTNQALLGQSYFFIEHTYFKKYNFKEGYFPVDKVLKDDNSMSFAGTDIMDNSSYSLKVTLDNVNNSHNKIVLTKDNAKSFLHSRKSSYGSINKRVDIKYYFIIQKIKPTNSPDSINSCTKNFNNCELLDGALIGHISKLEILDPYDNNNVLQTYMDFK